LRTLTIKQKRFATEYVAVGNASEAYRRAYSADRMASATVHKEACMLLKNPKVARRVAELYEQISAKQAITRDEIVTALRHAMAGAEASGHWSAAVQAAMNLARLGGLLVEKRNVTFSDNNAHLQAVSELGTET
jgi:phage terminase small subunit